MDILLWREWLVTRSLTDSARPLSASICNELVSGLRAQMPKVKLHLVLILSEIVFIQLDLKNICHLF